MLIHDSRLSFSDAVAAIIQCEDGKYLLQKRDARHDIWYPGHWGCFGGAIDAGESPESALRRELQEELAVDISEAGYFITLGFDLFAIDQGNYQRIYYTVRMSEREERAISLGEGSAVEAFDAPTMLSELRLTPYDAFALFLHSSQRRFQRASTTSP